MTKYVLPTLLLTALSVGGFARPAAGARGDANCNGEIDAVDLRAVVAPVFEGGPCADADVNGDGVKTASDLTAEALLLYGPSQRSAFDRVLDQIQPDGTITLDTARQMFQLAYGGLDDVTVPIGAPGGNVDGTIVLNAMLAHRDQLSTADSARLDEVLNANGPVSATIEPSSVLPASRSRVVSHRLAAAADDTLPPPLPGDDPNVQDFLDRIEVWLPKIATLAQLPFALPIDIAVYAVQYPGAVADTDIIDGDGVLAGDGVPARCLIRFFQGAIDELPDQRDNTVAHELWHCFEAVIVGGRNTAFGEGQWIVEGQAEYVAAKVTDSTSGYFEIYLVDPGRNLFSRSYNAIGFYVTLESDGADIFAALKAMLVKGAQSSQAAFDAALSATPRLLDTWGEMEFEEPLFAGDWNYSVETGMPPPPDESIPGVVHLDMADGSSQLMTAQAHSVLLWNVNLTTDFIHFRIPGGTFGGARLLDASGREYNDLSDVWLCQHPNPDQCKCPQGSAGEAPESQPLLGPMKVAASAGDAGVYGVATSISLDEICKQKQPPPSPSAFCEDARNLQTAVDQFTPGDLDPVNVQTELEIDVYWLGLMAKDAPADIVAAMQPVADAYLTANSDFASIGYRVVPTSEQDLQMEQAALAALTAVASQSQQVGAYVGRVCGFAFHTPGI